MNRPCQAVVVLPLSMIARAVELRPDILWIWSKMAPFVVALLQLSRIIRPPPSA